MPVQTELPTNIGTEDDWKLNGAASKILAVAADDGDTSVIYAMSGGRVNVQRFTFPTLAGVASPINGANLYARVREQAPGAGGRGFSFQWNSVQSASNVAATIHTARPSYVSLSEAQTALTLADVNGEHGFAMTAAGGPTSMWEVWCTHFYRDIDFTYSAGSGDNFAHLVGSLAAAIGAGLLLREMPDLARAIWRKTGTLIKPSEYQEALAAWNSRRWTVAA